MEEVVSSFAEQLDACASLKAGIIRQTPPPSLTCRKTTEMLFVGSTDYADTDGSGRNILLKVAARSVAA